MILITGATGNVGRELVKQLLELGEPLRIVTRDESKVSSLDSRIERVIGDLSEDATLERALQGVGRVFMFPLLMDPNHHATRVLLSKAKQYGIQHIVMLSAIGAKGLKTRLQDLHEEKEQLVKDSGIAWTILRPGAFMSNALQWLPAIQAHGKVFSSTGEGKTAPISPSDIATVAALALTKPGHERKSYDLTGEELLSVPQQVEILANVLGKPITCVEVPVDVAANELRQKSTPDFLVESLVQMWTHIQQGDVTTKNEMVRQLTGRSPESFRSWCEEHRAAFLPEALLMNR
jgi:uncharacterized protein YbjT (DUF2867 family)